jgi:DNA (cytosine-5)-methyltransferase 1
MEGPTLTDFSEPDEPVGTVTELFAGVGGFRIGLNRGGWKTIFSNQWEPSTKAQPASDVYVARFGPEGHSNEDIALVLDDYLAGLIEIPKTTLLVGGFPCQDYSVAKSLSSAEGLAGKKGVLWWEILRLVHANRPPIVFLENVDRLLKSPASQRGRDFAIMLASLSDAGYFVEWRVVNAAEYGFPQRRKRVFIVAKDTALFSAPGPEGAAHFITTRSVVARALPVEEVHEEEVDSFALVGNLAELTVNFDLGGKTSPFKTAGFVSRREVFTAGVVAKIEPNAGLRSILVPDEEVPDAFYVAPDQITSWQYLKGSKREERTHAGSGRTYFYSEGSMAFPDLLDNPSRTILTGEGGTSPSRFKHIIRAGDGRYRRLLPVELERLNGFPDDWTATGADGKRIADVKRAFFMGNALVIGVVERVGKVLAHDWVARQEAL